MRTSCSVVRLCLTLCDPRRMSSTPNVLQWPGNYHTSILWFFQFPSTASETQWLMFLQRAVRRSYNDNYTYVHFPQHRLTACHSVAKLCPALCNPMDCSEPCPLVFHHLPVCSNSCPLSQWCHLTISSSAVPFSSCPESFPASGSFPMSQLFASGGQSIRALQQSFQRIFRVDFP